jgi:hypothetical protein
MRFRRQAVKSGDENENAFYYVLCDRIDRFDAAFHVGCHCANKHARHKADARRATQSRTESAYPAFEQRGGRAASKGERGCAGFVALSGIA